MYGANTALPLKWNQVEGATNYALLMYDESAVDEELGPFIHWAVTGITDLNDILAGATQYTNSFREKAYGGPEPPLWQEPHTYTIVVYALKGSVNLEDDEVKGISKADFEAALNEKIITSGKISGIFPKQFEGTWEPTGQIALKELNRAFYQGDSIDEYPAVEYRLKVGDDEYIDLDDNNAKEIYISYKIDEEVLSILGEGLGEEPSNDELDDYTDDGGPEGYVPFTYLEPGEDKNLWLPIIPEVFEYLIIVATKDGKVYRTTLDWEGITEAEVSYTGPGGVVFHDDDDSVVIEIDFSQVTLEQLIECSSEEGPYYAIELDIDGVEEDLSNVVSSLRINFRDGELKKEEVGNLRYVTTKWLPGPNILFYTLDEDDSIYFVEFDVVSLIPATPRVENVSFTDENPILGKIAGTISWDEPSANEYLTGYKIYFLDSYDEPIGLIGEVAVGTSHYSISPTVMLGDVHNLGVVSVSSFGESPVAPLVDFYDADDDSSPVIIESITDKDENEGIDGRDFTVEWTPPTWAYENSSYALYILPEDIDLEYGNLYNYEPVAVVEHSEEDRLSWTGSSMLTKDSNEDDFTAQEYKVWILSYEGSGNWIWLSNGYAFTPKSDPAAEPLMEGMLFENGDLLDFPSLSEDEGETEKGHSDFIEESNNEGDSSLEDNSQAEPDSPVLSDEEEEENSTEDDDVLEES